MFTGFHIILCSDVSNNKEVTGLFRKEVKEVKRNCVASSHSTSRMQGEIKGIIHSP